jgi:hypothetical protein
MWRRKDGFILLVAVWNVLLLESSAKETIFCFPVATPNSFILLTGANIAQKYKGKSYVAFVWQEWLGESAMFRYACVIYVVDVLYTQHVYNYVSFITIQGTCETSLVELQRIAKLGCFAVRTLSLHRLLLLLSRSLTLWSSVVSMCTTCCNKQ